ncbi:MAG: transketolase [Synergistaceae bacterium]|jgi:transketolase|nr:transketolase [Synergistaceae bacterium]
MNAALGRSYDGCMDALCAIRGERSDVSVIELWDVLGNGSPGASSIRVGPAEQNAILIASGLALAGRTVFVSIPLSPLFVANAYEQIRESVAIPNLKVVILSAHDRATLDRDGASRQMWEDFALMRVLPNMAVLAPSDRNSAYRLARALLDRDGPAYMRLSCAESPDIYESSDCDFSVGGARLLTEGDGVTIVACGIMVSEALSASRVLASQGINAEIIDCYSIKPFPEQMLIASVRRTGCCVVAEKHTKIAGLYGAVTECLARSFTVPTRSVAIEDNFGQSGTPKEIQEYYGLTHKEIVHNVVQVWAMRRR